MEIIKRSEDFTVIEFTLLPPNDMDTSTLFPSIPNVTNPLTVP